MSAWNHSMCCDCWDKRWPGNKANRDHVGPEDVCCFCGERHHSGIYVREDPKVLACKGQHE
jgi:hypothetical protein